MKLVFYEVFSKLSISYFNHVVFTDPLFISAIKETLSLIKHLSNDGFFNVISFVAFIFLQVLPIF